MSPLTLPPRPIVLAGYPGAGKTTLGAILAQRFSRSFADGDALIARAAGMSVEEIFAREGESGFRQWERRIYLHLPLSDGLILAVGGGSLLDTEVRQRLEADATVICLTVRLSEAMERLQQGPVRPLLAGGEMEERFRQLWSERKPHYDSFSLRLDTSGITPEEALEGIIILLNSISNIKESS